ncbi:hypothetical protein ACTI_33670 [Actinoplanes sp. OR16]|uniref:hypothetical protein n=1 Tax=Actinoplanes sp. OR16 TaxID=946334 RepID=UPI000F71D7C0|nr:hypothetical protein [Actinoplanes sp. OR16]BBH66682.1 hypothetical protein ACTI_33670 [Actinoplanes sp. OR16]
MSHQEHAAIAITLRYSPLALLLGLFTPALAIDGQPVQAGWKRPIVMPIVPGRHHVHVHVPYILPRRIGKADLDVMVAPGQTATLEYRAPTIAYMRGALGGPPQKYPGTAATIVLLVFMLLLAFCAVGNAIVAASAETRSVPTWTPSPRRTIPTLPPVSSSRSDEPALREDVTARAVTGSTFTDGDDTATMSFAGWPFAFRTPAGWGCLGAKVDLPDAEAFICIDESNPDSGQRLGVMLRTCAQPCDDTRTAAMTKDWFSAKFEKVDDTTNFAEATEQGKYRLELDHFFGGRAASPKWQVAVAATAPAKSRAEVQKVADDILTQTS